jgi:type IV secretory pathway VirB9-like protein
MTKYLLALAFACVFVVAAGAAEKPAWAPGAPSQDGIRTEMSRPDTVIPLTFRMRYTTLLVLPEHEDILIDDCGDRPSWNIVVNHNIASITPKVANADTNLNIITKAGSVYSFTLKEGGKTPDLKVFVTVPGAEVPTIRKFYTVAEYEAGTAQVAALNSQLAELRASLETARQDADARAAEAKRHAPARLHFDYKPVADKAPFRVKAVFHDGHFTYIQTGARDKFSVFEKKDGKPSALNAQIENGTYIIPKVVEDIELVLGEARLPVILKSDAGS